MTPYLFIAEGALTAGEITGIFLFISIISLLHGINSLGLGTKVNFMMEDVLNIFKSLFMIFFIHVMIFNIYRHCYWSHPRRHPGGRTSHTR